MNIPKKTVCNGKNNNSGGGIVEGENEVAIVEARIIHRYASKN